MFDEIHLLRAWMGEVPLEVPLYPLWGTLVRAFAALGCSAVVAAKALSCLAYLANAALLFVAVRRFAAWAARQAEESAVFGDANDCGLEWVVAGFAAMTYLLTPAFVAAAVSPTPLLVAQLPPLAALFALSCLIVAEGLGTFIACTFSAGVMAGCAILCGPIGVLPLPLVVVALILPFRRRCEMIAPSLALVLGGVVLSLVLVSTLVFEQPLADLLRVVGVTAHALPDGFFYPGSVLFAIFGGLSSILSILLIQSGRIRPMRLRCVFFAFWGVAVLFLGIGTLMRVVRGEERPADRIVAGVLQELGSRKVIVTDGLFDDLLAVGAPADVTILRLGRETVVPETLLKTIADDDVRFAAEMGVTAFVTDWLKRDPTALARVLLVTSRRFETANPQALEPRGWCWAAPAGDEAPLRPEALRSKWETCWAAVADGLSGRDVTTWTMRRLFAVQGMAIAERLEAEGRSREAEQVRARVISEMDAGFSRVAEQRRRTDREKVLKAVRCLGEMDVAEGAGRTTRILALEESLLPELERSVAREVSWLVHVLKGELALRKGPEFHAEARDEYRVAVMDEFGDVATTAPKLLLLDAGLRDDAALERDAREVLRRDRTNRTALAILGNVLAQQGDNTRAEAYLRRATSEGAGPVMIEPLNDLAEVLSRLGRPDEALAMSERVVAQRPDEWTYLETRASILMRLGRLDEADEVLKAAVGRAREAKVSDVARNILDIDLARLMKMRRQTGVDYQRLLRNLRGRTLTPAQRKLVDEL